MDPSLGCKYLRLLPFSVAISNVSDVAPSVATKRPKPAVASGSSALACRPCAEPWRV